jgi:thiamine biosynthesis lipoprotein ApbE
MPSRRAVPVMGTVFSVDVRDRHVSGAVLDSTYRPASDISRLCRGEISVDDAHPDVAAVLVAVTVAGPSLTWADAYAIAAMAMGDRARSWLTRLPCYAAITVRADGSIWPTPGFASHASPYLAAAETS